MAAAAFGKTRAGEDVAAFTVTNVHGVEARFISYGANLVSLFVPDRRGRLDDVVLGYDDLDGYASDRSYFGAIVGRYANRIARGRFSLGGKTFELATNDGPNHLHGGVRGFDKAVWRGEPFARNAAAGVVFARTSGDGEEGYPGTLDVRVTYELTDENELVVEYFATTDATTVVNLAQHTYFNLAGQGTRDVLDHRVAIDAEYYLPIDATSIPLGTRAHVEETPFDFREFRPIGARIDDVDPQLVHGKGYDHTFVVDRGAPGLFRAARVREPSTGRELEISTTEPGIQFYSGNFLDGSIVGKCGRRYLHRYGFCLEPHHFPDSPNRPEFPSTVLRPGEEYRSRSVYAFRTDNRTR